MKNKNQARKPKNKGISATLIVISCLLFIASGVLIFLSLNASEVQMGAAAEDSQPEQTTQNSDSEVQQIDEAEINASLNKSLISIILDEFNVQSTDSLKAQTCVINTSNPLSLLESYTEYLDSLAIEGISYRLLYDDYDGDGADEYYLYIFIPVEATFKAFGDESAYSSYAANAREGMDSQSVIIYGDTNSGKTTFRSYYSGVTNEETHNISVSDGVLRVSHGGAVDEIHVVCTPYTVYEDYAYQEDAFEAMCDSYAKSINAEGYVDVYYYCADLSDAPGEETVFVYSDSEGIAYARVVTFINGKVHYIYHNFSEVCATFIVEINSQKYILEYVQVLGLGNENYASNYFYRIFRFDENFASMDYESEGTTVEYDSVSAENESFFAKFNSYLANAVVLADPYELTGYSSLSQSSGMSTHQDDTQTTPDENEQAYLQISNCSTSKQGIVNVPESSYLNFREGPSVDYAKILINPSDSDSYVRQLRGSSVTVIDTVNTGDEENPIWLRIQIKYNALTLVGYSSQAWIDLPGVKHISQGETFTVTADTNEDSLTWSCNDASVARIDSATGAVTAIKPGLVLITVTSESGLSDSCLIMVD